MLLPLLALIFTLSAIGIWKLQERKHPGFEFAEPQPEPQAEAAATAPLIDVTRGDRYERPLLEDAAPQHERAPLLVGTGAEPVRLAQDRSSLI
ncbi:hypothetical protein EC968_004864 [Mortierella alpina]|nr:hypothetical protein EC968_004864 [Mortierella alpina]